ncbi:MAG TPA: DUF6072 family protein [Bryobacteraceae bacterium]|nr:DUF6072 family protein [Bryobacteraceae bacterium]
MADEPTDIRALQTCAQFTGELLIPGGSNLASGNLLLGGIYAGAGLLARAMFGLPGLLLISTDSFLKATTGQHLHQHVAAAIHSPESSQVEESPAELESATDEAELDGEETKATTRKVTRSRPKKP